MYGSTFIMLPTNLAVALAILTGMALQASDGSLPLRPGLVGVVLIVGIAMGLARHWQRRGASGAPVPGDAERQSLAWLLGVAVLVGFLGAVLWQMQGQFLMHSREAHAVGIDTWTLFFGLLIALLVLRRHGSRVRDERDRWLALRASRIGYHALLMLVTLTITAIGFLPPAVLAHITPAWWAHVLILQIEMAAMVQCWWALWAYRRDALGVLA